ncbi:MAG TPA: hypothetical protein VLA99_09285 [Nitrospiraceae bacterium]|nr:hypothetical protein [Nitrospiraceae bacterium]
MALPKVVRQGLGAAGVLIALQLGWTPAVTATHEADHRFTVEGFVCGDGGRPVGKSEVVVKDPRISLGQTVETDERGYYKATLHLHNDNLGDVLVIQTSGEEQRTKVQFDPKDLETERKVRVDFGSGCQRTVEGLPGWVYVTVAGSLVGVAVLTGIRIMRGKQRAQPSRKRQKKQRR